MITRIGIPRATNETNIYINFRSTKDGYEYTHSTKTASRGTRGHGSRNLVGSGFLPRGTIKSKIKKLPLVKSDL